MTEHITGHLPGVKLGDQRSEFELYQLVESFVLTTVRKYRSDKFKRRIDSRDIVNRVVKSFFSGLRKQEFKKVDNEGEAKALLATIAFRIVNDALKGAKAGLRNVEKEVHSDAGAPVHLSDAHQPSPIDTAVANEFLEKLPEIVRGVHEKSIEILELSLDPSGFSNTEISKKVGLGARSIQIIKEKMRAACQEFMAGSDAIDGSGKANRAEDTDEAGSRNEPQ